ncbi:hypothetical protein CQT46_16475 [Salmonella enterica]|nr:hypothetical protein [Salmonella enterica]
MAIQVRVTDNPCNIGNGFWHIGKVFDVVGETNCFYVIEGGRRVNKKHLSIAGTVCGNHSVKVELITEKSR